MIFVEIIMRRRTWTNLTRRLSLIIVTSSYLALVESVLWAEPSGFTRTFLVVAPRVAKLFGAGGVRNLHGYGSGVIISPEGHIATVWSPLLDHEHVIVVLHDGSRYEGKLVGVDTSLDLALVKIEAENLPYFDLESPPPKAHVGQRILAFSNVFKVATGDEPVTMMHGVLAAITQLRARRGIYEASYNGPVYVVDAITNNSGAAGGALTTSDGELLGLLGKELRNQATETWLNYVIPLEVARDSLLRMKSGEFTVPISNPETSTNRAGQRVQPEDLGLVMIPDVVARTPAFIERVIPDTPASQAGLLPDDLVLFVDGRLITSLRMLREELVKRHSELPVKLVVRRGDRLITVELAVPQSSARDSLP